MIITDTNLSYPGRSLTAGIPNLNYKTLSKVCRMKPTALKHKYGLEFTPTKDGGYWYKDNGSNVLAVAHLDSVLPFMHFDIARLKVGTMIYCTTLDDRLGAYIILDHLPSAGLKYDILLTTAEEDGNSTARDFVPPRGKEYNWMFMFDRIGIISTVYTYENNGLKWMKALSSAGLTLEKGTYSCIKDLTFLGCKGVNLGVGYHNNHHMMAYAWKEEILQQVRAFVTFYESNYDKAFPHAEKVYTPIYNYKRPKRNIKMLEWKQKKAAEKVRDLQLKKVETESKDWQMQQTFLMQDMTIMNIGWRASASLMKNDFFMVAEVAEKSEVELLNYDDITKEDVDIIRKYLESVGLGLSLNIDKYNITVTEHKPKLSSVEKLSKEVLPLPLDKTLGTVKAGVSIYKDDDLVFTKVNNKFVWLAPAGKGKGKVSKLEKVGF